MDVKFGAIMLAVFFRNDSSCVEQVSLSLAMALVVTMVRLLVDPAHISCVLIVDEE